MKKISQPFGVRYIGGPQDGYVVRAEPSPTNVIIAPVRPFADRVTSGSNNGRTNKRVAVYEFVGAREGTWDDERSITVFGFQFRGMATLAEDAAPISPRRRLHRFLQTLLTKRLQAIRFWMLAPVPYPLSTREEAAPDLVMRSNSAAIAAAGTSRYSEPPP